MRRPISLFLLTGVLAMSAELPVKQVVLYKNGVGFFERSGELRSGESARLDFNAAEMNDVLKSLSITQRGGGPITGLRYDSAQPLAAKLEEFPFKVESGQALSTFLDQLRGARVTLRMLNGESAAGVVLSGRRVRVDDKRQEVEIVTLMVDSGEIRAYDLGVMSSLKFADAALEAELKRFLATLTAARSKEKKSIYIDSTDDQARQLSLSYMIPMPVWKSSYRLIFPATGDPTLEGWAIVDNTTGEDWTKVRLSLVSGRPVSFVSRLYEPKMVQRQTVELAEEGPVAPVVYGGVVGGLLGGAPSAPGMAARALMAPPPRSKADYSVEVTAQAPEALTSASTISVPTQTREIGDLFEYGFSTPVTVKKNESAMLPFLQDKIPAKKLLIYTYGAAGINPMSAAELTNQTGKTLDGGPLTIVDGANYAGEALIETVKTGDKRLISYAVDLGTRVTTAIDTKESEIRELKAVRGVITSRVATEYVTTYTIKNVDARAKTLIIEHPIGERTLLSTMKPFEKTDKFSRFEVKLAPTSEQTFVVREEEMLWDQRQVSNVSSDDILIYTQNRNLSPAGRKQLEAIRARKADVAQAERTIQRLNQQIDAVFKDQDRLRQNLGAMNAVSGQEAQTRKYAADLAAAETKLAAMRDQLAEVQAKQAQILQDLNQLIEKLEF
jgi:hypothetical protein